MVLCGISPSDDWETSDYLFVSFYMIISDCSGWRRWSGCLENHVQQEIHSSHHAINRLSCSLSNNKRGRNIVITADSLLLMVIITHDFLFCLFSPQLNHPEIPILTEPLPENVSECDELLQKIHQVLFDVSSCALLCFFSVTDWLTDWLIDWLIPDQYCRRGTDVQQLCA